MDMDPQSHKFFSLVVPGWAPPNVRVANPPPERHDKGGLVVRSQERAAPRIDRPIGVDSEFPNLAQEAAAQAAKLKVKKLTFGMQFDIETLWVGAHYSSMDNRWSFNLLPCFTIFMVLPRGNLPQSRKK
jgi:hypothetical protein